MKIKLTKKASKQLDKIPETYYKKIKAEILKLAENPYLRGSKKLTSQPGYRIRIGNYRVLYIVKKDEIVIARVIHRKDAYRMF